MRDVAARLAAAIQDVVRGHGAPGPRGLPWFGLEHPSGTGFHLLEALADRGIFRKYELVLDVDAGLGASSRWLVGRLGCEAVGLTATAAEAVAARELTRRARLAAQIRLLPGVPQALPFRAARFTHVWVLESLPRLAHPDAALAEAFRVVRRGGTVAVQDLALPAAGAGPRLAGWSLATADARADALRRAGFVAVETRDRTDEAGEAAAIVGPLRARLLDRLDADPVLAPVAAERRALGAALRGGALRVVQLLARRP